MTIFGIYKGTHIEKARLVSLHRTKQGANAAADDLACIFSETESGPVWERVSPTRIEVRTGDGHAYLTILPIEVQDD